jgi:hypothetical protein
MNKTYYFTHELKQMTNDQLKNVISEQWEIIRNDKKYLRPNNRATITNAESILEDRGVEPY